MEILIYRGAHDKLGEKLMIDEIYRFRNKSNESSEFQSMDAISEKDNYYILHLRPVRFYIGNHARLSIGEKFS
jgi:hypothetical protein